jgi:hypothetical protein
LKLVLNQVKSRSNVLITAIARERAIAGKRPIKKLIIPEAV